MLSGKRSGSHLWTEESWRRQGLLYPDLSVWAGKEKAAPGSRGLAPKRGLWRQMPLATEIWCGDREQIAVSGHGLQNSRDQGEVFSMPDP